MYRDPWNLSDETINKWPYWLFEENIKIINSLEEENINVVNLANPNLQGPLRDYM
jgi:hypothetical protein